MTNMSAVTINTPEPIQTLISSTTSYSVQGTLGEGDYGKVVKCLKEDTKEMVAVKVLKRQYCQDTEQEAAMLQYLSCLDQDENHLLKLHEKFDCRGDTCLALEMLDISLWDLFISRGCKPQGLNTIRQIAQQLLIALNALECLGVLHLDIKPDNIMVANRNDPQINVKLIDFGLAKRVGEVHRGAVVQPIGYRAPEIYLGQPITTAVDVWGVGCVLAFLFTGFPLFPVHCKYQNMQYLVDTLGMPDQELLDSGGYTHHFFIQEQGPHDPSWRFMTREEFELNTSIRPKMTDPAIPKLNSLADLVKMYPASSTGELWDRFLFVDLLKHLLHVDWKKRITPRQALQHQFFWETCQSTPDTHILSNNKSLSSDEVHEEVSSSSDEEFGFWTTRAPVPAPCAHQASPDVVDGEMGDCKEVSSSSDEEFGFWTTRAPVPAPCAHQASSDVVDGETGDRKEVSSSSEEEEFGFWKTRAPVPAPCAHQASSDVVEGEMGDCKEVSSSSDEEFGFWTTRAPVPAPCAHQASSDVVDGETGDRKEVSSSSEEEEFGFWKTRAPVPAPCAHQASSDVVEGEMGDCKEVSSSSDEEFGFWTTRAPVPAPCAYQASSDVVDGETGDRKEVSSSSEEEEFGFWKTRAPVPAPCAHQASSDVVEGEMGDMVANPEEATDITCYHPSSSLREDSKHSTSEDDEGYDADKEDNDHEEEHSDVEDLDNREIFMRNSYVLWDMYCACQARSLQADSGLFDCSGSPDSPRESPEVPYRGLNNESGICSDEDSCSMEDALTHGSSDTFGLSSNASLSSDEAQGVISSSSDEEFGFWKTHAPVSVPCAYQASLDVVDGETGDCKGVSSSSEEEFGFWKTRAPVPVPCAYQASPDVVDGETGDCKGVSSSSEEEFGFWKTRAPVPAPCAHQASSDVVDGETGDRKGVSSSSDKEFGFWKTRAPVPVPCAYQASPDVVDGETGYCKEVSSSSDEEFGFWKTRSPVPAPCAYQASPEVVDGETGDRKGVSSSSDEEFGFWKTRASDEGTQSSTKDGDFSARVAHQMASPAEALVTPNLRKRVKKRIWKSCSQLATSFSQCGGTVVF